MKSLVNLLKLLNKNHKKKGLFVLIISVFDAFLQTVGVASIMPFLAVLSDPTLIESSQILSLLYKYSNNLGVSSNYEFLIILGLGSLSLTIFSSFYRTYTHYIITNFIEFLRHDISHNLLVTFLRQPYEFFIKRHSSDLIKTVISEIDNLTASVIRPVFFMLTNIILAITMTFLLVVVEPKLAVISTLILVAVYYLIIIVFKKKFIQIGEILFKSNAQRFKTITEVLGSIKSIKLIGKENYYISGYSSASKKYSKNLSFSLTLRQAPNYFVEAIVFGALIALTLILLLNSTDGLNSKVLGKILPILGMYAFAAYRLKPALQLIFQGISSLKVAKVPLDNILSDYTLKVNLNSIKDKDPLRLTESIKFQKITYKYPDTENEALNLDEVIIKAGSVVGIAGATGAGKTTFVDVLLGLLSPSTGKIYCDDKMINLENIRSWQNIIGYVPQEIQLIDSTFASNIALGESENKINMKRVIECCKMAQIHDFIESNYEDGYASTVGEKGVKLSGGQRQRIGIARALYNDPDLIVFDEATSALDPVTEKKVMSSIYKLSGLRTIILIAHRLSTIEKCDKIFVLDDGRIRSVGSYSELIKNDYKFKEMTNTEVDD